MTDTVLQISRQGTLLELKGDPKTHLFISHNGITGRSIYDIMAGDLASQVMACVEKALQTGDLQNFEYQSPLSTGDHFELKFIVNGEDKVLTIISNITIHKHASEKVKALAYYDSLTRLPNRYLFNEQLKRSIAYAEREGLQMALLFIDLDNFKHINDSIGHSAGDQLLHSVSERLLKAVRKTDSITRVETDARELLVARLGGDEFTILLDRINDIQDPAKVSHRIIQMLSEPFVIGTHEVYITASIGIAIYPLDGNNFETLLINADVAMYQAKEFGRNNYQYYSESRNKFTFERLSIENKLRKALDNNEFMLFYQPQIDIATGRMTGVEALIRWMQPDLVLTKPSQFIPLAEETGLIVPMGEWTLRTACEQNKTWQKAGFKPICMTVNVSGVQFMQGNFVETVSRILRETGLAAEYLQLEVTESTVMKNTEASVKTLHSLKAMGIHIAIDDFGTGYSSLSYLKRFPLSTLKIDGSFIRDLNASPVDQSIVRAIVGLAHNFNLKVIAECVETTQQLDFLRKYRCEGIQGFLICPPVNSIFMSKFIKKEKYL